MTNSSVPMTAEYMRQLRNGSVIECNIEPCEGDVVDIVIVDSEDEHGEGCACRDYYHNGHNNECMFAFDPRGCPIHHKAQMGQTTTTPLVFQYGSIDEIRLVKL